MQVMAGQVSEPTRDEKQELTSLELEQVYRLACRVYPIIVLVPSTGQRTR